LSFSSCLSCSSSCSLSAAAAAPSCAAPRCSACHSWTPPSLTEWLCPCAHAARCLSARLYSWHCTSHALGGPYGSERKAEAAKQPIRAECGIPPAAQTRGRSSVSDSAQSARCVAAAEGGSRLRCSRIPGKGGFTGATSAGAGARARDKVAPLPAQTRARDHQPHWPGGRPRGWAPSTGLAGSSCGGAGLWPTRASPPPRSRPHTPPPAPAPLPPSPLHPAPASPEWLQAHRSGR